MQNQAFYRTGIFSLVGGNFAFSNREFPVALPSSYRSCGHYYEEVQQHWVWPKTRPGPLALHAARPGLKRGPAAHTVLCNRNVTSHATSRRRLTPGLVYCEVKLTTVGMPTSLSPTRNINLDGNIFFHRVIISVSYRRLSLIHI